MKSLRDRLLVAWITCAVLGVPAAVCQEAQKEPSAFTADIKESRVYIRVDPDGRGHAHGVMGTLISGKITLGANSKAGELVFDMKSFDADSPAARAYVKLEGSMSASDRTKINQAMHGSSVLDSQKFPRAVYTIASTRALDDQAAGEPGRYRLDGHLDLHGARKPVRFDAKLEKKDDQLVLRGNFTLVQTNHGIQPYSALLGLVRVKDEMQVFGDIVLEAVKK